MPDQNEPRPAYARPPHPDTAHPGAIHPGATGTPARPTPVRPIPVRPGPRHPGRPGRRHRTSTHLTRRAPAPRPPTSPLRRLKAPLHPAQPGRRARPARLARHASSRPSHRRAGSSGRWSSRRSWARWLCPAWRVGIGWLVALVAVAGAIVVARSARRTPDGGGPDTGRSLSSRAAAQLPDPLSDVDDSRRPHADRTGPSRYAAATRRPGESVGDRAWRVAAAVAATALVGVAGFRAAGWLVAICLGAGLLLGSYALAGGRSWARLVRGLLALAPASALALGWAATRPGEPRSGPPSGGSESRGGSEAGDRALTGGPAHHPMQLGRVVAGVAVGLLLLVVFGALFRSADPAFARLTGSMVRALSPDSLVRAGLGFVIVGMLALGATYLTANPPAPERDPSQHRGGRRLGLAEWIIPLAMLDALFGLFVWVQITVLFAGDDFVLRPGGPDYAVYARGGSAQLGVVTILTLGVLAVLARWAGRWSRLELGLLRLLGGVLCGLTLVVVASALTRLNLYARRVRVHRAPAARLRRAGLAGPGRRCWWRPPESGCARHGCRGRWPPPPSRSCSAGRGQPGRGDRAHGAESGRRSVPGGLRLSAHAVGGRHRRVAWHLAGDAELSLAAGRPRAGPVVRLQLRPLPRARRTRPAPPGQVLLLSRDSAADRAHRPGRLQERRDRRCHARRACPTWQSARQSAISSSPAPPRSRPRRSVSSWLNRQLRTWPSAVSRVRSQAPQNGWVTLAITPTLAGLPTAVGVPVDEPGLGRRRAPHGRVRGEREHRPQLGQDLLAGHHLLAPPGVLRVERHLLDEAHLVPAGQGERRAGPPPRRR